jgi:hypothetical protein
MNIVNMKVGEKLFKSRTGTAFGVEPNRKVWIKLDEERVIFFDKETGESFK